MKDRTNLENQAKGRCVPAFTLVEMLIVITIIVLLVTILLPSLGRARALTRQSVCASNQREIIAACIAYAEGHFNRFTTGRALPSNGPTKDNWWKLDEGNPGSLWLLVDKTGLAPDVFLCPDAKVNREHEAGRESDGQFKQNTYSYSYISMVELDSDDPTREVTLADRPSSFIILADRNPRCTPGQSGIGPNEGKNSPNHAGRNQNVASLDGAVSRAERPDDNPEADDIYAANEADGGSDAQGKRGNPDDVFLIP
jgi:type II secretory pathway pseudopilin PulG